MIFFYIYIYHLEDRRNCSVSDIYMNLDLKNICKKAEQVNVKDSPSKEEQQNIAQSTSQSEITDSYESECYNDIDNLYHGKSNYPLSGDDNLTYRMYDMGQKNKHAIINRAMWDKNSLIPYLEEELRTHANSIWWDDETLEHEF